MTRSAWLAAGFCALFLLAGITILPYPGLHNDEALAAAPLYHPAAGISRVRVFGASVPLMLISYLGCLKTWLWAPVLAIWAPDVWSFRLPAIVVGALTIWIWFTLVRRWAGERAAVTSAALLATDTTFLLTTVFDWGPVALQHLLLVASLAALTRFDRTRSRRALALAFFLFGLGLWDKALFIWSLAGIAVAGAWIFHEKIRRAVCRRNVLVAAAGLVVGALPLLVYNVQTGLATARESLALSPAQLPDKVHVLGSTLDGSGLFGYIVSDEPGPRVVEPGGPLAAVALSISRLAAEPRHNLNWYGLGLAIVALPFVRSSPAFRAAAFGLVCGVVAWTLMAITRGAGGSVHHTVLLWPMPQLAIGAALAESSRRLGRAGVAALIILTLALCGSALLVSNQHYVQWVRYGVTRSWTDAIHPLNDALTRARAGQVWVLDWGIFDSLLVLSQGSLPLRIGSDALTGEPSGEKSAEARRMLADPGAIFVAHTGEFEEFPGVNARLRAAVAESGCRLERVDLIHDRAGRAVFEILRCAPG